MQNRYDADQKRLSNTVANQGNKIAAQGNFIQRLQGELNAHGAVNTRQHSQILTDLQANHPVVNVTNVVPTPRAAPSPMPTATPHPTATPSPTALLKYPSVTAATVPVPSGSPLTKLTISYGYDASTDADVQACMSYKLYPAGQEAAAVADVTTIWKATCKAPPLPYIAKQEMAIQTSFETVPSAYDSIQRGNVVLYFAIWIKFKFGNTWEPPKTACNVLAGNSGSQVATCPGVGLH